MTRQSLDDSLESRTRRDPGFLALGYPLWCSIPSRESPRTPIHRPRRLQSVTRRRLLGPSRLCSAGVPIECWLPLKGSVNAQDTA